MNQIVLYIIYNKGGLDILFLLIQVRKSLYVIPPEIRESYNTKIY